MTSPLDALKELQAYKEEQKRLAAEREKPKAEWFMWTDTGAKGGKKIDTVMARFLNDWNGETELGKKNGPPILKVEHTAPGDRGYLRRALCTKETEGECYACERHAMRIEADKGQWKQRTNFYMNALVDFGNAKKVVIMSRNANASFVDDLITELEDEKDISGANYRVKVTGEKTTTKWGVKRQSGEPFDVSNVEAFNIEDVAIRHIPYAEQAEYYGAVYQTPGEAAPASSDDKPAVSPDAEW